MRHRGVSAAWSLLNATGADRRWAVRHGQSGATILMYHAVLDEHNERWVDPEYAMPLAQFEAQMAFLAAHRNVLSLRELAEMVREGTTPRAGSVVITFDNGYLCTLRLAAPVLKRHGLPATVFLPTGPIGRDESLWMDQLYSMFNTRRTNRVRLNGSICKGFDFKTRTEMREAYRSISGCLLSADPATRDSLLDQIAAQLSPTEQAPRVLIDWGECARWLECSPRFEVGAHTREHVDLSRCTDEQLHDEIAGSVADVRERLGVSPPHFSCPYGRGGDRVREVVKAAGCTSLCYAEPMSRATAQTDVYGLTRFGAPPGVGQLGFVTSGAYPEMSRKLLGRA